MNSKAKPVLLEKGSVLNGGWEILGHIATGGMAEVFRARQIKLDREVDVKFLSQELRDSRLCPRLISRPQQSPLLWPNPNRMFMGLGDLHEM